MHGLFGGGKAKTTAPVALSGLQLQSSAQGVPVQIVYGKTRIAGNLIWYGDFAAIPQSSSGSSGGKGGVGGGGGGKGGGGSTSYNYQTSFMLALCEGPIIAVDNVYVDKNVSTTAQLGLSTFLGTYPQTPWGYLIANHAATVETHTVPGTPYQVTVDNAAEFFADLGVVGPPVTSQYTQVTTSPASGQYKTIFTGRGTANYQFNSANAGAAVVIQYAGTYGASDSLKAVIPNDGTYVVSIPTPYGYFQDHGVTATNVAYSKVGSSPIATQYAVSGAGVYTFAAANAGASVTISYATISQNDPYEPLGYNGIAYEAAAAYQLGNSAQLPNFNFEVEAVFSNSISGQVDADASQVVSDLLTNTNYGVLFPVSRVGSLAVYQAYTIANGLWVSPAYNQQTQASSILDELVRATNSEFVWSGGLLTIVPYGDQTITANGYTYTAPSVALYDPTDDDFMPNNASSGNSDPVVMVRKRPSDAMNSVKLECLDRNNFYNPAIVEAKDQALIDTYGLRASPSKQTHLFADLNAGRLSAQLQLQRQAVRNVYQFTLDQRYILLDPMDIVTITDTGLGLAQQWVRITEITENDDGSLDFVAEEYLGGTGSAPAYSFQSGSGFTADYNSSPGNANTPIIFEPPVEITETGLETWLVASGANWGGCDVWVSPDDQTYRLLGRMNGSCRQGTLTSMLASGSDPDTVNTLSIDLSEAEGQLLSGTQSDADDFHTLCYVDGELISYQTATLTAQYEYALSYLRRGAYGTAVGSHSGGTLFARLDNGVFKIPYDKAKIGNTIFVKLLSFNIYGGGQEALSDVTAYTHVIAGPPLPGTVQNFSAQQVAENVAFSWADLVPDSGLLGYDIAYATMGETDWSKFIMLTEALRGTEMTNASVPPGSWTFAIRGHDIADQLGPMTTYDLTVTNFDDIVLSEPQQPDWGDVVIDGVNAVVHYTGKLVPMGKHTSDTYAAISAPAAPVLSQLPGGALPGATYYVKLTYVDASGETLASSEASLVVSASNLLVVRSPDPATAPGSAIGYKVYVNKSAGTETLQSSSPLMLGANWVLPITDIASGAALPSMNTTGWQVFDIFVPDPFPVQYFAPSLNGSPYDTGYDDTLRVWISYKAVPGPGQSGQPTVIQTAIDTWLTGGSDLGNYIEWTIGTVLMRYIRASLVMTFDFNAADPSNPGNVCYLSDFTLTVDKAPVVETGGNVVIAPGGTTVTFPTPFHIAPFVQATPVSGSALYATVTSITTTTCVIHVWNSSGSDVGGTINFTASGE